eukprot:jgi/Psemu1/31779/gm1.31779_g
MAFKSKEEEHGEEREESDKDSHPASIFPIVEERDKEDNGGEGTPEPEDPHYPPENFGTRSLLLPPQDPVALEKLDPKGIQGMLLDFNLGIPDGYNATTIKINLINDAFNKALNEQHSSSNIGQDGSIQRSWKLKTLLRIERHPRNTNYLWLRVHPPGDLGFISICRDAKSTLYFVLCFEKEVNNLVTLRGQWKEQLVFLFWNKPHPLAKQKSCFQDRNRCLLLGVLKRASIGNWSCNNVNFNLTNPKDMKVNVNLNANQNANLNANINPNAQQRNAKLGCHHDNNSIDSHEMEFDNQSSIHETDKNTYNPRRRMLLMKMRRYMTTNKAKDEES